MARPLTRVEEPGELGETETGDASSEQCAREPHGVDDRQADSRAGEPLSLAVEEGEVEARVVCDEDGIAGEAQEAPHGFGRARRAAELLVPEAGHCARSGRDGKPGVDERLELGLDLEAAETDSPDLANPGLPGSQSRRLEVDDDVGRVLEQQRRARRLGECDRVAVPGKTRVGLDHVCEERARESDRGLAKGEEPPRRVFGVHRPTLLFDELHQAIGRV